MKSLWKDSAAKDKNRLELLVYRSRLIGSDPELCLWGGGNTSAKLEEIDFRGRRRMVLRVKGSGSDLKESQPHHFSPMAVEDLLPVFSRKKMSDEEMVAYFEKCLLDPKAPRPSIEALLHAFIPEPDIDHAHADAILALTNTARSRRVHETVFGEELLFIPYIKPGFLLAKKTAEAYRKNPQAKGAILEKHGIVTWGPDSKTSYRRMIEMVRRSEAFIRKKGKGRPVLGGARYQNLSPKQRTAFIERFTACIRETVSRRERKIMTFTDSPAVLQYVNARLAPETSHKGAATPDHMLRTKRIPLFTPSPFPLPLRGRGRGLKVRGEPLVSLSPQWIVRQIERYAENHRRYYEKFHEAGQPMLDPYPRVILIPRVGMFTTGKNLAEARIVQEIYEHSMRVQAGASFVDRYQSLPLPQAFEMEYWSLELYKLSLAPKEKELARRVAWVTGAAGGIGRSIVETLAWEGAQVVALDLDRRKVEELAQSINRHLKAPQVLGLGLDVTKEASVANAMAETLKTFGGIDFLVSNAGVAHVASVDQLDLKSWEKSFQVNATGHFLVARRVVQELKKQKMGGALVFIASKNVLAPGKDFAAYSAAKSAETQLARVLAIEGGEVGIRANIVHPDGVFEGSGLWDHIKKARARSQGIRPEQLEKHYQNRNLMKVRIEPRDVAEAVLFLLSQRSAKTTGCMITVDGGLREAFPR